jgi:nicotinate phosphoribosyltransferase
MTVADVLSREDDPEGPETIEPGNRYAFWHPSADYRHFYYTVPDTVDAAAAHSGAEPLLKVRFDHGKLTAALPHLRAIQKKVQAGLETFDTSYKRLLNPHVYKVSVTQKLRNLKLELIRNYLGDEPVSRLG